MFFPFVNSCGYQIQGKTEENNLIDTYCHTNLALFFKGNRAFKRFLFTPSEGTTLEISFISGKNLPWHQSCSSLLTWSARGFHLTFFRRAGAETRVFWGRFFKVKITPFGSSRSAFTRFFSCQPTLRKNSIIEFWKLSI